MNNESQITAELSGLLDREPDTLIIRIPLDLLKFALENNPDFPLVIKSAEQMGRHFAADIAEFGRGVDESGLSTLERLLDDIGYDAYESGKPWVAAKNEEES